MTRRQQLTIALAGLGVVAAAMLLFRESPGLFFNPAPDKADGQSLPLTLVYVPEPEADAAMLKQRKTAQFATVGRFAVDHDFQFADRVQESGISFVHRSVDDAGLTYKSVHYDHGTGVAIADVDGDGLEDIYFVNQRGGSGLWRNLGAGRFADVTAEAGVALADRIKVAASFADIDNDGNQDLFVTTVRGGNALFENDGRGHFTDIAKVAGVDYVGHSSGAVFFDFDHDGLLDLYVSNVGRYTGDTRGHDGAYVGLADAFAGHLHPDRFERAILYRNLGQRRFAAVTLETGLGDAGWSGDASVADLNGDGFPDLYTLNMQGGDHYFESVGGKTFVDRTDTFFPRTSWGAMGIKFFDYNNDGRFDLFVTDMHSDMSVQVDASHEKDKARVQWNDVMLQGPRDHFIFGNALFRNAGHGSFEEVSDRAGVENYWPWGPSVNDLNADGWQDIFIASSMNFPFHYGVNSVLLNNRGERFLDSEFLLGVEPRKDGRTHTPWFDLDCSLAEYASRSACEGHGGKHVRVMATLGSRSSVMFDLDGDGDIDIVTNDFNSAPQVLVSDLAQRKPIHWLKVTLEGTVSNRNGLGASVAVSAGGRLLTQWNDGKSGYLSQSVAPLYFGLGAATSVDRIEVRWPSGLKQVLTQGLQANSTLRITEPR